VDAANLGLLTGAVPIEEHDFRASKVAAIDHKKCNYCELCRELCRFEAISEQYEVNPVSCEGCAFCAYACPEGAVTMKEKISGHWYISHTAYGYLVHAKLGVAEENSGKLVTRIRNKGEQLAEKAGADYLVIDGPAGIGCPVIASLQGTDTALIVTEPTKSGLSDLKRILEVAEHFGVDSLVLINKYDINEEITSEIVSYCQEHNIVTAGKIPYDEIVNQSLKEGELVLEYAANSKSARAIRQVWKNIEGVINNV